MTPKWRYVNGTWSAAGDVPAVGSRPPPRARRVTEDERRSDPRLRLSYPIEVRPAGTTSTPTRKRTVTQDLSARGVYFCTSGADAQGRVVGESMDVVVTVPHKLMTDGRDVSIDLRGEGRIVRIDRPARGSAGEDGVQLTGIALQFDQPFDFTYCWI